MKLCPHNYYIIRGKMKHSGWSLKQVEYSTLHKVARLGGGHACDISQVELHACEVTIVKMSKFLTAEYYIFLLEFP